MNNDLISRDYVEKIIISEFVDLQDGTEEWRTYVNDTCENILNKVHNAPTVDFIISPEYVTELQNINKGLIKQLEDTERLQGEEWIDYDNTFYKCPDCGYLLEKCCPVCQTKVILPKGGAKE